MNWRIASTQRLSVATKISLKRFCKTGSAQKMDMKRINTLNQDQTFCFVLVTRMSIGAYFFEWDEHNHKLQMKMLNTICGWPFVRGWNDQEYNSTTGKAVRMNSHIKNEAKSLRDEICTSDKDSHKSLISSFYKTLLAVEDDELFFIYRVVYTFPSQRLRYKIFNELSYINEGKSKEDADEWFDKYAATFFNEYEVRYYRHKKVGELERSKRVCRFCGRKIPDTTFDKDAHTVPESIGGNKNLICYEECDNCNQSFGEGIERNLYQWFDFRRSIHQVRKKSGGVPKAYGRNYVVEDNNVNIILDKNTTMETKLIGAGTVTLQGIYRALCKIAIDLIDTEYLDQLKTTIKWIRFGRPKSSHYPQIAQMHGLCEVKEPAMYICSRINRRDADNAPLHFCILRIFDLAFLYVLPHVNGRMIFHESYTRCIPTEALRILGFTGTWEWDSYDTTEERNPHVWINLSNSKIEASDRKKSAPIEKLRRERKPIGAIDFKEPKITAKDFLNQKLGSISFTHTTDIQSISGDISVQAVVDLSQIVPLFIRLNITYEDIKNGKKLATIMYSAQISPKVLHQQMNLYEDDSFSLNQDLLVRILETMLESLYRDIFTNHSNFPYTREMLYINSVRELLNDMQLFIIKDGQMSGQVHGRDIWHTGY